MMEDQEILKIKSSGWSFYLFAVPAAGALYFYYKEIPIVEILIMSLILTCFGYFIIQLNIKSITLTKDKIIIKSPLRFPVFRSKWEYPADKLQKVMFDGAMYRLGYRLVLIFD